MQNRAKGYFYEKKAAEYLSENGYSIIETNYSTPYGEIDIICSIESDGEHIIFVEVKYRKTSNFGLPEEAVGLKKQSRIKNSSLYYIGENNLDNSSFRYDVISFSDGDLKHIINAFDVDY